MRNDLAFNPNNSDIVFVQDTQRTSNGHLDVCSNALKNIVIHSSALPRYQPEGIRFGLIAFCDGEEEHIPDHIELCKLTNNRDQFLYSLQSLKARRVAPLSDGTNHALHFALEASMKIDWNANADRVVVLSIYKRSRPLGMS